MTLDGRALADAGAAAWPELRVPVDELAAFAAARPDADPARAGDLFLACACARGDARAVAAFEAAHGAELARLAARFARPDQSADDALQLVRAHLFIADDGEPRVARYGGKGALRSWACAAAARALIDDARLRRPPAPLADDDLIGRLRAPDDDPELAYLKRTYRAEFKAAFEGTVAALDGADRNLLRYHYLHALSIDQLAVILGCHRATAARKLSAARDALLAGTRRRLGQDLGVAARDVDSIMRLVGGDVDLSLHRLLGSQYE
jgi:RNA polymerase sigma-70 factor, ECF subfamily